MTTDCPSGKPRYPSFTWAIRFAIIYKRLRSRRYGHKRRGPRAYHCPECGGFHLTTASFAHRDMMFRRLESKGDDCER